MSSYIILLVIFSFFSISVYEGFVILGLLILFLKRKIDKGVLSLPLAGFVGTTILSTTLYFPKMLIKSLSEGLFQFIYLLEVKEEEAKRALSKLPYVFVLLGILGIPFLLYNWTKIGSYKVFWGGVFETAQFYTIFSFASFLIWIREINFQRKLSWDAVFYLILSVLFLVVVVLSHRRSYLLAVPIVFLILFILLRKNGFVSAKFLLLTSSTLLFGGAGAYYYLSLKDIRFKTLNEVILGKRELNSQTINIISSHRYNIMLDGISIIKKDLEEGRYINLLIGHGIRSGLYLPHEKSPKNWERYESVILVSELIERGLLGLVSILFIYFLAFKKFISLKLKDKLEVIFLIAFIPLLIHLIASVFTFFWDALLPLYLFMFKFGEKALKS